jgi:hypothetical protein
MAAIDQVIVRKFIETGLNGTTTAAKGSALEDLICYVFGLVPGISITHRDEMNQFATEEIDVAFFNDGLSFLPNVVLVESKNWSKRVGSSEVAWFAKKLETRGLDFGILVTTLGITGEPKDLTAAHFVVATELAKRRRLILFTTDEIMTLTDTDELVHLIKKKLCDLAVKGTIG